jgi:hypothetical protein
MPFPVPILLLLIISLILLILQSTHPKFKYFWLIASVGAVLAFFSVLLWHLKLPQSFTPLTWQLHSFFINSPVWSVDSLSWVFALAVSALVVCVILTSMARNEVDPVLWAGSLALGAVGLLVVTAGNPLALVLVWAFIDLMELIIMLRSTRGERQSESAIITFTTRIISIGLVIWAITLDSGLNEFSSTPPGAGIYFLFAAVIRLGVLPIRPPNLQENILRRGFSTSLRIISAVSGLILLARIPSTSLSSPLLPFLLFLVCLASLYAGWLWLNASDEHSGFPFWVLGMSSLAAATSIQGNPIGSASWGLALILVGSLCLLYSARQRTMLWFLFVAGLCLFSLPYTLTSSSWRSNSQLSFLSLLSLLPAQALLIVGFIRHVLHPGESNLESHTRWEQFIYLIGLVFPLVVLLLLGIWGWEGALSFGYWWVCIIIILLVGGLVLLNRTLIGKQGQGSVVIGRWLKFLRLDLFYSALSSLYKSLVHLTRQFTGTLEGEGGILWSFLLLVLLISIFMSFR